MDVKEKLRENRYLLAVAVSALAFYVIFVHGRLYGEINGSFISYGFVMKDSTIPFWSAQLSGGYPLYANPEVPMFGILNLILLLSPNVILAFSFTILVHILIAGVGAALLSHELTQNKKSAIVSGIAYMFIGSFAFSVFTATMPFLYPLAFLPLIFLFAYRALQHNTLRNSIIAAALLAYQIISGGMIHFLWSLLGVGAFLGVYFLFALLQLKKTDMARIALIAAVLVIFTAGFSAVKLLPALEFNKLTNRAEEVSYDDFIWKHTQITLSKIPSSVLGNGVNMMRTGAVVLLLSLAAFLTWRKKYVMAFAAVALIALLIELGTPLTRLIYHLPGYDKTRQIYNVLGIFSLAVAVFAGVGWAKILEKIKSRQNIATAAVILLIAGELFVLGYHIQKQPFEINFEQQLQQNHLLQNVSSDRSYYRLHLYGEDFVGLSLTKYAVPFGIRMLDWTTGNVWFNDYVQFTTIAGQQNSAKLWGVANVKYIASKQPLNITGLRFSGEFEECGSCDLKAKYLYENTKFLPEAYTSQKAVLVLGKPASAQQLEYQLLLDSNFNPGNTVLISSESVPQNPESFGIALLTENPSSSDAVKLQSYAKNGGIVEPNIFEGGTSISYETVANFLASDNSSAAEAEIRTYEPRKLEITAKETGFLILSEKFYKFNGWKATVNNKPTEKFNANAYSTAVHLNKGDTVIFEYSQRTFYAGLFLTVLTIIAAVAAMVLFKPKR